MFAVELFLCVLRTIGLDRDMLSLDRHGLRIGSIFFSETVTEINVMIKNIKIFSLYSDHIHCVLNLSSMISFQIFCVSQSCVNLVGCLYV